MLPEESVDPDDARERQPQLVKLVEASVEAVFTDVAAAVVGTGTGVDQPETPVLPERPTESTSEGSTTTTWPPSRWR